MSNFCVVPNIISHNFVCNHCGKTMEEKMKCCGNCQLTFWCSVNCQQFDESHKEVCRAIRTDFSTDVYQSFKAWVQLNYMNLKDLTFKAFKDQFQTHCLFLSVVAMKRSNTSKTSFRLTKYLGEELKLVSLSQMLEADNYNEIANRRLVELQNGHSNRGLVMITLNFNRSFPVTYDFSESRNQAKAVNFGVNTDDLVRLINSRQ